MFAQVEKPKETKSRAVANSVTQKKNNAKQGYEVVDNRSDTVIQKNVLVIQRYPSYQTFQDTDRNLYCSSTRFKNHDEGAMWVRQAIAALGVRCLGRPAESHNQPPRAIIGPPWPQVEVENDDGRDDSGAYAAWSRGALRTRTDRFGININPD
jgi:hypothetical protein